MYEEFKDYPAVLTFVPLLYVAWADNVLSPSEVNLIRETIDAFDWLSEKERKLILEWSNPSNPPNDELFNKWSGMIRDTGTQMDASAKNGLVEIGIKMADIGTSGDQSRWSSPKTIKALNEICDDLGTVDFKQYADTLPQHLAPKVKGFNVSALQQILDGEFAEMKESVRLLLADPLFKLTEHPDKDVFREKVLNWCQELAKQGYGALALPEKYGGKNDIRLYAAVFETLGYHDLSLTIKFGVQFGLFGGSVLWLGTEKHHDKFMKSIGSMELPGCFAMTETGHGSNVRELKTTATYDTATKEFIIHTPDDSAQKEYIGNALHGQMASVFAQLVIGEKTYGVHTFLVPLQNTQGEQMPGVEVFDCGYKLGLNGVDNGRIKFTNVRIPKANLLNKFADVSEEGKYTSPIESDSRRFFTMLGTLVGGRVCVPMAGLSATKTGLTIAIRYALKRRQFGAENAAETLLLDYPSHQKRLMPYLANAYASDFALKYLLERFAKRSEKDIREIETLAAALKSWCTWNTTKTLQECREACGGKGYLFENRLADLKADTEIFTTFEGDNTVLMQLVAKGLLTEFKEEFNNIDFYGILRYVSEQISRTLQVLNPVISRRVEESHLSSMDFHKHAFNYRERSLVLTAANRLRKYIKRGMSSYEAFIHCQNVLIELGNAYAEKVILEHFAAGVEAIEDQSVKKVMRQVYNLFALNTLQKNSAWYLEKGYLEPVKSKAIRKLVERLCLDVRQQASGLVDAFNIPDSSVAAAIV